MRTDLPRPHYRKEGTGRESWKFLEPDGIYYVSAGFRTPRYPGTVPWIAVSRRDWKADAKKWGYCHTILYLTYELGQEAIVLDMWATLIQEWPDPIRRQEIMDTWKVANVL